MSAGLGHAPRDIFVCFDINSGRLWSKAVDWEVSGSMLTTGILSLTGPSPRVLKELGRSLMPLCSAPWCLKIGINPMSK